MKLLLILLALCFATRVADGEQSWVVSGTISSQAGPVSGVFVQLRSGITERAISARTGKQGEYHLSGTTPGKYILSVQKKDNLPDAPTRSLTLQPGKNVVLDIHISEGAVLAGRVVDSEKRPVRGAIVHALLVRRDQTGRVRLIERGGDRTNDRGEFRVPYLAPGKYALAATPRVFTFEKRSTPFPALQSSTPQSSFYPAGHDFESAILLDLNDTKELAGLDIAVSSKPSVCLGFRVGEGFSEGLVSGVLEDQSNTSSPQLAAGELAAGGSYQVCGLPKGEYRLRINSLTVQDRLLRLLATQAETADLSKGSADLGTVQPLGKDRVAGAVTLAQPGQTDGSLSGVILMLTPLKLDLPVVQSIHVQSKGTFSDTDIPRVEYRLTVQSLPEGFYVCEASQQGRSVLAGGLFPGNGDVTISLATNGATLSGQVLAKDDKPVLDATVFLVSDEGQSPLHVQTDQDGNYAFSSGLRPGTYKVAAASAVPESQRDDVDVARTATQPGNELHLQSGQRQVLNLHLSR